MPWRESWQSKLRRRFRKPYNKLFHSRHYYVSHYRGADFLLKPSGISTLEISARIAEHPELTGFMRRCAEIKADTFIDIGANIGLYSCILLRNGCVPRAVLFEPDRVNLVHLQANLLINGVLDRVDLHDVALGDAPGAHRLVPGQSDGGFSQIVGDDDATATGYDVKVVRLDDLLSWSGRKLAIKIDVEHYECHVLAGMERTLRENRCVVQIETFEFRDQVTATMAAAGYKLTADFSPNFVFENA